MNYNDPMQQYHAVSASSVSSDDPVKIIRMLYESALDKLVSARSAIRAGRPGDKAAHIDKVVRIIDSLQMHLDPEQGGQIAVNLDNLYEYMKGRLLTANMNNDEKPLDEVATLLAELNHGWRGINAQAS